MTETPLKYSCSQCATILFSERNRFDLESEILCFDRPVDHNNIHLLLDKTDPLQRTKVMCNVCRNDLGYLYLDGVRETINGREMTGMRFCVEPKLLTTAN